MINEHIQTAFANEEENKNEITNDVNELEAGRTETVLEETLDDENENKVNTNQVNKVISIFTAVSTKLYLR